MFQDLMDWFEQVFDDVALTFFAMLSDLFSFLFDVITKAFLFVLDALALGLDFMNPLQYISMIPDSTLNMMGVLGISEAMSIIISATGIKLLMQMIPFIGLGRK